MKVLISDISQSHASQVKQCVLLGNPSLDSENVEISFNGLTNDLDYAKENSIQIVVRSTTGAGSNISKAKRYYPDVLLIMPAGSNEPGEIFEHEIPQVILITGAGDTENETGDNVEFISNDPITLETTPDEHDLSSYSNGFIAGQISKIISTLNCSSWEARYRAKKTGSKYGVWDDVDGYGFINVESAISYGGSIPADPFIDSVEILKLSADTTINDVLLSWCNVENVLRYLVYKKYVDDDDYIHIGTVVNETSYVDENAERSADMVKYKVVAETNHALIESAVVQVPLLKIDSLLVK
jgi:hypothetical protein